MCGRYSLFVPQTDLEERFGARFEASFTPRYNAAPGQHLPVITDDAPESIRTLEWGLVPAWSDDGRGGLINALAETVAEKPSFRDSYRSRRCLVLADGFYEWVETAEGKRPYRIAFADDRPFAMAGLWARWEPETRQTGLDAFGGGAGDTTPDDGGGESGADPDAPGDLDDATLESFTIVTTDANELVADLHDRMPVILDPANEGRWLEASDPRDVLGPHPSDELRAYPVSTALNSPANDEPSLVEPVESG